MITANTTPILIFLLITVSGHGNTASNCTAPSEITKYGTWLLRQVVGKLNTQSPHQVPLLQLQTYYEQADVDSQAKAIPLINLLAKCDSKFRQSAKEFADKAIPSVLTIAQATAVHDVLTATAKAKIKSATATTPGATQQLKIELDSATPAIPPTYARQPRPSEQLVTYRARRTRQNTATIQKLTPDATLAERPAAAAPATPTSMVCFGNGNCQTTNSQTHYEIRGKELYKETAVKLTAVERKPAAPTQQMWLVISDEQGSQTSHALHELYNAVEAYKPETTPCWPFNKKSDQDFRADVQQTLLGTEPTKEGEGDKVSAINSMIDNTYGTDIKTFNEKFWNTITGTNVAKSRRDTAPKTEIKSAMTAIAAVDMLGTAKAVSWGARKKAAAVARDTLKSQDKQKSECETKNKDQCKADNGCELKNDKCVAKVEETGTASTQNTTGNNSFVIKKSPLWLAFLLF
uniref:Variable surface glycoprotein n=1 Tax=Trypanosoma evansi TaxID=5697 RepID=Q968L1_TRYEV|nr:variable surface glycoprotein [Trypanosoma evansi]